MAKTNDPRYKVRQLENGDYYWKYDLKAHNNDTTMVQMVKICTIIWLIITVIMLFMLREDIVFALLTTGAVGVGMVIAPLVVWKLWTPDPAFLLKDTYMESWPKYRGANILMYDSVRRVIISPHNDMIELRTRLGGVMIFIPPEDYARMRDILLARIPSTAEIDRV